MDVVVVVELVELDVVGREVVVVVGSMDVVVVLDVVEVVGGAVASKMTSFEKSLSLS
jgi:hypothetical protein